MCSTTLASSSRIPLYQQQEILSQVPSAHSFKQPLRNDRKIYRTGACFVGHLDGTKQKGWGQFNWPNGSSFEGNYVEGERHGDGKYTWPDGSTYVGQFVHDKRHGYGEMKWPSGEVGKLYH